MIGQLGMWIYPLVSLGGAVLWLVCYLYRNRLTGMRHIWHRRRLPLPVTAAPLGMTPDEWGQYIPKNQSYRSPDMIRRAALGLPRRKKDAPPSLTIHSLIVQANRRMKNSGVPPSDPAKTVRETPVRHPKGRLLASIRA